MGKVISNIFGDGEDKTKTKDKNKDKLELDKSRLKKPTDPIVDPTTKPPEPGAPIDEEAVAAREANITAIRDQLAKATNQLISRYGARRSLLGGSRPLFGF